MTWAFFDRGQHERALEDFIETWDAAKALDGYDNAKWEEAYGCLLGTGQTEDEDEHTDKL